MGLKWGIHNSPPHLSQICVSICKLKCQKANPDPKWDCWTLARRVKATGCKMVLSGEGADEIFGGYLYFHKAPDATEFQKEIVTKVTSLHKFDCLRANKSTMAWGVEARVPFLDRRFLE